MRTRINIVKVGAGNKRGLKIRIMRADDKGVFQEYKVLRLYLNEANVLRDMIELVNTQYWTDPKSITDIANTAIDAKPKRTRKPKNKPKANESKRGYRIPEEQM